MADSTRIIDGSFKGIPIRIDSGSVNGGRKTSKKEFPNRDTQTIEDLGLRPRVYNLQIVIAPRTTVAGGVTNTQQGYFEYRDAIIAAIENKGPGELIHPLYGRIENVVATTYSINEDFTDFGRSRLNVTFETSSDTGIPRQTITAISQLTQANNLVNAAVNADISDNYSVSNKFTSNFTDAANKINEIIDSATEATAFLGAEADKINEFNSFLGELSADVNSLVTDPSALGTSVNSLFSNIDGLFGTVENTAKAFAGLFDFGGNDEDNILPTTAGRNERIQNRGVLNGSVNASALGYSYVNVSQTQFQNVREIEEAADDLEVQFQRVMTSGSSDQVISSVTDMRVIVQQFFDEQKITLKQIISVNVYTTPARVLSYQYYAESTSADQILELNGITDVSFVDGTVEIVTA
jgi:prophage DNA circulation protein